MKIFQYLVFIQTVLCLSVSAQKPKADPPDQEDTKTLAYGITTNNHSGILGGFVVRSSTPLSSKNGKAVHTYLAIEAVNLKNLRERSILSAYGSRFVFGKSNHFFSIRPQYGREFYIFNKDTENSVGFSAILAAGPSLGLEKPYYIKYAPSRNESPQTVPFNPDIHTNIGFITGSGSILQGMFKGIRVIPGAHVKAAANLDMSTFNNNVTGFEVGTVIEFFSSKPEILSSKFSDNPQAFATVYLTLYFGNKKLLKSKKL
jgi:hypothetical protein